MRSAKRALFACCVWSVYGSANSTCQDLRGSASCSRWQEVYDGCTAYHDYMATVCNRTCGFCSPPPPPLTTTSPTTAPVRTNCTAVPDVIRLCDYFKCEDRRVQELCPLKCGMCLVGTEPETTSAPPGFTGTEPGNDTNSESNSVSSANGGLSTEVALISVIVGLLVIIILIAAALVAIYRRTEVVSASTHKSEIGDQPWRQQFDFLDSLGRQNSLKQRIFDHIARGPDSPPPSDLPDLPGPVSHWEQRRMLTARLNPSATLGDNELWPDTLSESQIKLGKKSKTANGDHFEAGNASRTHYIESKPCMDSIPVGSKTVDGRPGLIFHQDTTEIGGSSRSTDNSGISDTKESTGSSDSNDPVYDSLVYREVS